MKCITYWLVGASLTLLASAANAQLAYHTSYDFNINDGNGAQITNIMLLESGGNFGATTWAFSADGIGETTITNPFSYSSPVTSTLIIGLVQNLPNDPAGQYHVVLGMDNTAASDSANIDWTQIFRTTDEDTLVHNILLATSGQDWPIIQPGLDAVGAFSSGDAMTGPHNPDGTTQSSWFATGGSFTVETWTDGTIIGTGTSTVFVTPEPCTMVALGLGGLAIMRRKFKG